MDVKEIDRKIDRKTFSSLMFASIGIGNIHEKVGTSFLISILICTVG